MAALGDSRGFLTFWTASTVSGFGTYITALAVEVLVVLTLHQGAAGVGLVAAAQWLPYLLFGVVAGVLVDRSRRLPLLIATDLIRAVLLLAVPLLAFTHHLSVVVLMAFMAVFGLMSLINDAASQSFLPRLVPGHLLTPANARLDQSDAVAQTSGPAVAGALVSLLTAPWAVLVDAVSYLVSGLVLLRIRVTEPPSRPVSLRGVRSEAVEGLRWVYGHRMLRPYAFGLHAWFLIAAVVGAVIPTYALRTLGLSAFAFGLTLAAAGVGGVLGALAATRLGERFGVGRVVIAANAGTAVGVAILALSTRNGIALGVGEFVYGLSLGAENSNSLGYRQAVTPDRLQARMNTTLRSINRAMIVVGAPLGGLLADAIGLRVVLWLSALGLAVAAAGTALTPYRHASLADAAHVDGSAR